MASVAFPIVTPCGTKTITLDVPFDFAIDLSFFFNIPFPPPIHIPLPDCGLLEHLAGVAPEPAEDSVP